MHSLERELCISMFREDQFLLIFAKIGLQFTTLSRRICTETTYILRESVETVSSLVENGLTKRQSIRTRKNWIKMPRRKRIGRRHKNSKCNVAVELAAASEAAAAAAAKQLVVRTSPFSRRPDKVSGFRKLRSQLLACKWTYFFR